MAGVAAFHTYLVAIMRPPRNRHGRIRTPNEDEKKSLGLVVLTGLLCLQAYYTFQNDLQIVPAAEREVAPALYAVVHAYKTHHESGLWDYLKDLDATMRGLLSPLQVRVVCLVNWGGPLSGLEVVE